MRFRFNCICSEQDYCEFSRYTLFETTQAKKNWLRQKIKGPIIILIVWLVYMLINLIQHKGFMQSLLLFVFYTLWSLLWVVYIEFVPRILFKYRFDKIRKKGGLTYTPNSDLYFYDDYFVETTKEGKIELRYDALAEVCVNKDNGIYLFQNSSVAFVIPFSTFQSLEERAEFIKFIKEKTGK